MALDAIQQDEMESMAAIFAEDFTLCSQEPMSYSIRLRKAYESELFLSVVHQLRLWKSTN